jgi:DNA excision repair protein ERCC-3
MSTQATFVDSSAMHGGQVGRFTSEHKEEISHSGVMVTSFTMVAYSGKRNAEAEKVMDAIRGRDWGLLLLDEVSTRCWMM